MRRSATVGPAKTTFDVSPQDGAIGGLLGFVGGDEARAVQRPTHRRCAGRSSPTSRRTSATTGRCTRPSSWSGLDPGGVDEGLPRRDRRSRRAHRVRAGARRAGRAHPLGRHRDGDLLARLHGRRGALGRAGRRRDPGAAREAARRAALVGAWPRVDGAVVAGDGARRRRRPRGRRPRASRTSPPPAIRRCRQSCRTRRSTSAPSPASTGATTGAVEGVRATRRPAGCCAPTPSPGRRRAPTHAVQVAEHDARGRLYLLDQHPPRVVRARPRAPAGSDLRDVRRRPHVHRRQPAGATAPTPWPTTRRSPTTPPGCRTARCSSPTTRSS